MFAKVILLFCIHDFLIKTVSTNTPISYLTQKQFSEFKGPDLCGKLANNIELHKAACNKVASNGQLIEPGSSLTFKSGYPKCMFAKVQTYDSNKQPSKVITTMAVMCANTQQDYAIGKGQSPQGVVGYQCANKLCEAVYDVPDAVPKSC